MKTFPKLFKKSSKGLQEWEISVDNTVITTRFGQVGCKIQEISEEIFAGKNIGKANETSAAEQAELEAQAKWTKQKERKGYTEDKSGKVTHNDGWVPPMLAHKYEEHGSKLGEEVCLQPKLDGIRCLAVIRDHKVTLWSRQHKEFTGVPHINKQLSSLEDTILDGELFSKDIPFEDIVHYVKNEDPVEGHEKIEYHVYDAAISGHFADRNYFVAGSLAYLPKPNQLRIVNTAVVKHDLETIHDYLEKYEKQGYEGVMVRDIDSPYENKRSYGLLKLKSFQDAEYDITGVESGRGKMEGKAIFICVTPEGKEFRVKMRGELEELEKYMNNEKLWRGKKLTVKFQNLSEDGIPRFPVGTMVRDYE